MELRSNIDQTITIENTSTIVSIPIQFFVVEDENGSISLENLQSTIINWVEYSNETFPDNFDFYICDIIFLDTVPQYYDLPSGIISPLLNYIGNTQMDAKQTVNVGIVNSVGGNAGSALKPNNPNEPGLVMVSASRETFVHELGHYFGLDHTFQENEGQITINPDDEHVLACDLGLPKCDCEQTGDMICDTPVDISGFACEALADCSELEECTLFSELDSMFYTFTPDVTNFMSYYARCRTNFSTEQKDFMLCVLLTHPRRSFLIDTIIPNNCNYQNPTYPVLPFEGYVDAVSFNNESNEYEFDGFGNFRIKPIPTGCERITYPYGNFEISSCGDYIEGSNTQVFLAQNLEWNKSNNVNFDLSRGVTVADLIFLNRHVLNLDTLAPPYNWIAADVNNDGEISIIDLVRIRRAILTVIDEFEEVSSWRLMPRRYLLDTVFRSSFMENPFTAVWNNSNSVFSYIEGNNSGSYLDSTRFTLDNTIASDEEAWSFYAIKSGDANGSNDLDFLINEQPTNIIFTSSKSHKCIDQGETFSIRVKGGNSGDLIQGYQFEAYFDPNILEIISIGEGNVSGYSTENFNIRNLSSGVIQNLWFDPTGQGLLESNQVFFEINAKANTQICNIINAVEYQADQLLRSLVISNDSTLNNHVFEFEVVFEEVRNKPTGVWPNPAVNQANFDFSLLDNTNITIQLFDQFGNSYFAQPVLSTGTSTVNIPLTSMASGLIYYQIFIDDEIFTGTIIKS